MAQERLNHLMLVHVHKQRTEKLDLKCILNAFVAEFDHCNSIFCQVLAKELDYFAVTIHLPVSSLSSVLTNTM